MTASIVATLVADPNGFALTDALIDRVTQAIGASPRRHWLSPAQAIDLYFCDAGLAALKDALCAALAQAPVDLFVQPAPGRIKKLLIADMDSTLIGQECIDELAAEAGLGARVAAITERAMRGEIAFEPALRERVGLLKGLPEAAIAHVLEARIALTPGARILVQTMRARGAYCTIVSGGFSQFTSAIAARLGVDEHRANRLIVADGELTGEVEEPILGRDAKLAAVREISQRLGLQTVETLAVGDGANDLAMLGAAGLGVAWRAKPAVAAAAHARIDHGDLTALLFAQGIARDEFVLE